MLLGRLAPKKINKKEEKMENQKKPKDMRLGDLISTLIGLKEEYMSRIVDKNHPRPETWDKYGGIVEFNKQVFDEYEKRRKELISELNKRG